jgi:phage gpG-like protein
MSARFSWHGDRAKKSVHQAVMDAVQKTLLFAEGHAKKHVQVDTSRLRSSITHEITSVSQNQTRGRVGTNVAYAPHVEYGTWRTRGKSWPFLRPAVQAALAKAPAIFKAELDKTI